MFDRLRVRDLPELGAYARCAPDASTLQLIIAAGPPADWSEAILTFIRKLGWNLGSSSWEAREALQLIGSSGGRLCTVAPDELRYLRSQLLDLRPEDFLWLVKWLKKEKHCDPAIFSELTRTAAMREKLKALKGGERYITPSQKMSRANERRRRAKERATKQLPNRG
jgi:hypothetical protein